MTKRCNYIPRDRKTYPILLRQKSLIERNYNYLKCNIIDSKRLICHGVLQPNSSCDKYKIKLTYEVGKKPQVHILDPKIVYNDEIHLYKNGSLCLFHPTDLTWDDHKIIIAKTIIPWVSEWIVFYEIWKITKKWLGAEVRHKPSENKN